MSWWPKYKPGPAEFWVGEALTEGINGFIEGWGAGIGTGSITGAYTGTTDVGRDMTAMNQVWLSIAAVLGAMIGNGIHSIYVWHKTHRFPNPFVTGNTNPPFPPTQQNT